MKRVSIIVPVFNVENYLKRCVDSIIDQTYADIEIILVDDGSTDSSGEICDDLSIRDNRIIVIHKKNGGLSDARNAGLDVASGHYIFFVDSDDFICNDAIKTCVDRIEKDGTDLAIVKMQLCSENGELISKDLDDEINCKAIWNKDDFWNYYYNGLHANCVVAWNKLYKKSIFEKIRYCKGRIHEDEIIIHHIVSKCKSISFINEKKYWYSQRGNSITGKKTIKNELDYAYAIYDRSYYFLNIKNENLAVRNTIDFKILIKKIAKQKKTLSDDSTLFSDYQFLCNKELELFIDIAKVKLSKTNRVKIFFAKNLFAVYFVVSKMRNRTSFRS